jgi:hypothetical protein
VKQDGGTTVLRTNHENIQRAKLKVDARKWMAVKLVQNAAGLGPPKGPTVLSV